MSDRLPEIEITTADDQPIKVEAMRIAQIVYKHCRPDDDDKAIDAANEILAYLAEIMKLPRVQ
jgi:hypothetical protein